jgi:hypothetical protein
MMIAMIIVSPLVLFLRKPPPADMVAQSAK